MKDFHMLNTMYQFYISSRDNLESVTLSEFFYDEHSVLCKKRKYVNEAQGLIQRIYYARYSLCYGRKGTMGFIVSRY
jgi:hypothetical protein